MTVFLMLLNLIFLVLVVAVLLYAFRQNRRRQQNQQALLQQHAELLRTGRWFRVRYASQHYHRRWLKFFPWQDNGILHLGTEVLTIFLAHNKILRLPAAMTDISWQGMSLLPNGLLHWLALQHGGETHYLTSETGLTVLHSQTGTHDIFMQLADTYPQQLVTGKTPVLDTAFALEKNRGSLVCIVLFFGLLLYFLIDNFFVLQENYLTWPSHGFFIGGGLLALVGGFRYMERHHVPRNEKTVIALLLCAGMVGALYPGLRRINQLTDSHGLQPALYHFSETRLLIPQDSTQPRITIAIKSRQREYWAQFQTGDTYEISLRHGGLRFYQMDMAPVHAGMRDFYEKQRELKQQNRED